MLKMGMTALMVVTEVLPSKRFRASSDDCATEGQWSAISHIV